MMPSHPTPSSLRFSLRSDSLPSPSDLRSRLIPQPALAPPSISASTVCMRVGSPSLHLPDSLGLGSTSHLLGLPDSLGVGHAAQFLAPVSSSSGQTSSAQAQEEPSATRDGDAAQFFEGTKVDPVYLAPDRAEGRGPVGKPPLHPNRPIVNRGKAGLDEGLFRPFRDNVAAAEEPNHGRSQTLLLDDSLVHRMTVLTQTQRELEEAVHDMEATNIDLSGRVHDVEIKTTDTIIAQQLAMSETSNRLFGRIEKVRKKGSRVEAKRTTMEAKLVYLMEDTGRLEVVLGAKKEKLKKMNMKVEKSSRLLKYGCIGGLVVVAACVLFK